MSKKPLYQLIACAVYSAQHHNDKTVAKVWREIAKKYVKENFYPHGELVFDESDHNKIVIRDQIPLYDDNGYRIGTYGFTVTITPNLCFGYDLEIKPEDGFPEEYSLVLDHIEDEYSLVLDMPPKVEYYPKVLGWDNKKQPYPEIVSVEVHNEENCSL